MTHPRMGLYQCQSESFRTNAHVRVAECLDTKIEDFVEEEE